MAWRVISKQILPRPLLSVLDTRRHFSDELMAKQMNRTTVSIDSKTQVMISIVYGSPAAGSGNKRAALIGGHGRHLRPIFANWLY
jgi:hypothetical protein